MTRTPNNHISQPRHNTPPPPQKKKKKKKHTLTQIHSETNKLHIHQRTQKVSEFDQEFDIRRPQTNPQNQDQHHTPVTGREWG